MVVVGGKRIGYGTSFIPDFDVLLARRDVLEFLSEIPDGQVALIVTSPPYNIGKSFEKKMEFDEYLEWQRKVISECVRVLKPNGSVCWQVGNYIEHGEVFPLDLYFYPIFKAFGLSLRNRIVWHYGHGLHCKRRFSGRYQTILWFTKGENYTFNLDDVRVPQKYPGKKAYEGPRKGQLSGNPLGKNPDDVWEALREDWESLVWNIPNVKSNHPEKTFHPAQFPVELVERLVLALTNPDDLVLDPFAGVGSSLIASALNGRKSIGVDREKAYTDLAFDRVVAALQGKLRTRKIGTPIYKPKPGGT